MINELYNQYLNRDVDPVGLAYFQGMPEEQIVAELLASPEYQFNQQFQTSLGRPIGDVGRTFYMDQVQSGAPMDQLLRNIANSPEAMDFANQGFAPNPEFNFSAPDPVQMVVDDEVVNPNVDIQNMQITGGSQILPTPAPQGFYGQGLEGVELMDMFGTKPMFGAGVGAFTDLIPTQFQFGIPAQFANVPVYTPTGFDESNAQKAAEALALAEANPNPAPNYAGVYLP